jgi:hypothetical protein
MRPDFRFSARLLALVLLLMGSLPAWSQLSKIVGKVEIDGAVRPFEVVKLYDDHKVLLNGYLTDEQGNFEFKKLPPGSYTVTIDYFGNTIAQRVSVAPHETRRVDIIRKDVAPRPEPPKMIITQSHGLTQPRCFPFQPKSIV